MNIKYGDRFFLKMVMKDKYCLVLIICFIRSELEKNCVNILYIEGERFNLVFKY